MSATPSQEVTQLLNAWSDGDRSALDKLLPLVEAELHQLAHRYMSRERQNHTLQTTALVNEAYLKLIDQKGEWQNRAHFFGIAAQIMELRYFGGLSVEETATVLGVSADTITRDWRRAKAFLRRELSQH